MPYKDLERRKAYDRVWQKHRHLENKKKAIALLGGQCVRCGITDYRVLEFDHKEWVRRIKGEQSGGALIQSILSGTTAVDTVQILCCNCHAIKTQEDVERYVEQKRSGVV